jgi:hypothetical protein
VRCRRSLLGLRVRVRRLQRVRVRRLGVEVKVLFKVKGGSGPGREVRIKINALV